MISSLSVMPVKLGKRLKALLKDKDMTQRDLAKALGRTEATVSLYASDDREPDVETLQRMAGIFGVTVDYLIGRSNDPKGYIEPVLPDGWDETVRGLIDEGVSPEDVNRAIELIKAYKKMREG